MFPIAYPKSDGSEETYTPFVTTDTWTSLSPVYADLSSGKLTTNSDDGANPQIGYVVSYDISDTNFPVLTVRVNL